MKNIMHFGDLASQVNSTQLIWSYFLSFLLGFSCLDNPHMEENFNLMEENMHVASTLMVNVDRKCTQTLNWLNIGFTFALWI
jgi:hypothetical protein